MHIVRETLVGQHMLLDISDTLNAGKDGLKDTEFANAIELSVHDGISGIKDLWHDAQTLSPISVYQRYGWIDEFIKSTHSDKAIKPFIVLGKFNGEVVFILPFEIRGKFIKRIHFIGGKHVNFNMGLFPTYYAPLMTKLAIRTIFKRIANLTPGMGYMRLCGQPIEWQGEANPLLHLPNQLSPHPAFVLDLEGGFEKTLARGNAKRKHKKFRQQCRAAEALGGYELLIPESEQEINDLANIFFEQKTERLKRLGIRDIFSSKSVNKFVKNLAQSSKNTKEPLLRLYGLKVDGEILAVFSGGVLDDRLSGYFSSISMSQHSVSSPGEMLLYLIVQDCCERGYTQLDLGAGDERYKNSWSSKIVNMHDVIVPLSVFSIPFVMLRRVSGRAHRFIRGNPTTWKIVKNLRVYKAKYLP